MPKEILILSMKPMLRLLDMLKTRKNPNQKKKNGIAQIAGPSPLRFMEEKGRVK